MRHGCAAIGSAKLRLLYGAAAAALCAGAAEAQPAPDPETPLATCQNVLCREPPALVASAAAGDATADGLGPDGVYLEADTLTEDGATRVYVARGSVEARYQGRVVRADEVTYQRTTGVVTARGNAVLINADGSVQYADEVQLDEELSAGVALGFATRLPGLAGAPGAAKIAAASAVRRSETVTELNRAIYTPCNICTEDGRDKTPTFSIQAERITRDTELGAIVYRDATLRIAGAPVLYTPYFAHPDPTIERRSGFLAPQLDLSDRRGFTYQQPYLLVISPSQDLVIAPELSTRVNPFVETEYRKRFYSGEVEARFGYTYEQDFNDDDKFGDLTHRSYLLARGRFDITPDWRWGFSAERASEDLIFDKYDVNDVYETRGLYEPDNRRLLSQLYTVRQTDLSYVSVAAFSFQGLRFGDDDGTFPLVAPLIEARWEPNGPVLGGRLRALGSAAVLEREEGLLQSEGVDSRRVTGELDYRRSFTLVNGMRIEPFGVARADAYSVGDSPVSDESGKVRGLATAGVDLSWPFIRPTARGSIILEPLAQLVASNDSDRDPLIPNEDSLSFEFDETNLFEPNKFPGFDRFEGGLRLNTGVRATADLGGGIGGSVLVGRSFRAEEDEIFPERVGLRETASDYIVAATLNPTRYLSLFTRARLDSETLEVQRSETRAAFNTPRLLLTAAHAKDVLDINGRTREDLDVYGRAFVTRRIGVDAFGVRDVAAGQWRRQYLGVFYTDECLTLQVYYEREETFNRTLGPSQNIGVRLTLATLGDTAERGRYER